MRTNFSRCLRLGLAGLTLTVLLGADDQGLHSIFDGESGKGWMLCDQKPLAKAFVQPDGLNPHGTGSYLVVHDQKAGDFVLDFDYKLTRGCNSGVFVRTSDLNDPVNTGIEIALDDTTGSGMHDPGAFYDLVAPKTNAQKPAGEWNHMTITARGTDDHGGPQRRGGDEHQSRRVEHSGQAPGRLEPQVHERRDRQAAPHRLLRVPGSRQRLLVQEHQVQVALMMVLGRTHLDTRSGRGLRGGPGRRMIDAAGIVHAVSQVRCEQARETSRSPASAVTAAAAPITAAPVAATAAPVAAAVAAAPVAAGISAWVGPGRSLAAVVIPSDERIAAGVLGSGGLAGGVGACVGVPGAGVASRKLVIKPVAGQSSAKPSEHAGEEAPAARAAVTIAWAPIARAGPHAGTHSAHPHLRGIPAAAVEEPAQDPEQQEHSEDPQADHQQRSQAKFPGIPAPRRRHPGNRSPRRRHGGFRKRFRKDRSHAFTSPASKCRS